MQDGTKSIPKIFANIFIAFIGAGVLGVPYAFKEVENIFLCCNPRIKIAISSKKLRISVSCYTIEYFFFIQNHTPYRYSVIFCVYLAAQWL